MFLKIVIRFFLVLCFKTGADEIILSKFYQENPIGSMEFKFISDADLEEVSTGLLSWDLALEKFFIKQLLPMKIDYLIFSNELLQIDYDLEEESRYNLKEYLNTNDISKILIKPNSVNAELITQKNIDNISQWMYKVDTSIVKFMFNSEFMLERIIIRSEDEEEVNIYFSNFKAKTL